MTQYSKMETVVTATVTGSDEFRGHFGWTINQLVNTVFDEDHRPNKMYLLLSNIDVPHPPYPVGLEVDFDVDRETCDGAFVVINKKVYLEVPRGVLDHLPWRTMAGRAPWLTEEKRDKLVMNMGGGRRLTRAAKRILPKVLR